MIHSILLIQFICLTVLFHNLSPGPLWSFFWSGWDPVLHTPYIFSPNLIFFFQHMPIQLFYSSTNVMSSIPNLSQRITWISVFYLDATHPSDHSHHIFFHYGPLVAFANLRYINALNNNNNVTYCFAHNCCTTFLS